MASGKLIASGHRVDLRQPTAQDEEQFIALVNASQAFHHPWVHPPCDHEEFCHYLARAREDRFFPTFVVRKDDGRITGVINVSEIVRGSFQSAYLGYYAQADQARRGYLSEGMSLLLSHLFDTMGLHRVEANIQPDNHASVSFVKKLGFEREGFSKGYLKINGEWKDHERWAIRCERWKQLQP